MTTAFTLYNLVTGLDERERGRERGVQEREVAGGEGGRGEIEGGRQR